MKTIKVETWLPLFPGFYNTLYEMDIDLSLANYNEDDEWHHEERKEKGYTLEQEIEYDNLEIDNSGYENAVVKSFVEFFGKQFKKYIKNIVFQSVVSPREYNYENDFVNIEIEIDIEEIQKFFDDESVKSVFADYLKGRYTSHDGFMSFHSNNVDVWLEDIKKLPDIEKIDHKIGSILEFIANFELSIEGIEKLDVYEIVMGDVYSDEFCTLQDKEID